MLSVTFFSVDKTSFQSNSPPLIEILIKRHDETQQTETNNNKKEQQMSIYCTEDTILRI